MPPSTSSFQITGLTSNAPLRVEDLAYVGRDRVDLGHRAGDLGLPDEHGVAACAEPQTACSTDGQTGHLGEMQKPQACHEAAVVFPLIAEDSDDIDIAAARSVGIKGDGPTDCACGDRTRQQSVDDSQI
ncbi:MAG: hypothetical protein L0G69_16080 [Brevibacterium sp.]|nr:hypothetical protein [Brevibacterium sp.]